MDNNLNPKQIVDVNGKMTTVYVISEKAGSRLSRLTEPKTDVIDISQVGSTLGRFLFSGKTGYIVEQLDDAIADQMQALANCDAPQEVRERTVVGIGIPDFTLADLPTGMTSDEEGDYNKGWLDAFSESRVIAKANHDKGVFSLDSKSVMLRKFLGERLQHYKVRLADEPNGYNEGAVEAFSNWLGMIRRGER